MAPGIFRTRLCSKCKSETDRAALVKVRSDLELCARCLEVEFRAGVRIVRGHLPWFVALPIGVFVIGGPVVTFLDIPDGSRAPVGVIVGFIVMGLARVFPFPGAWTLSDAPAYNRLDVDSAIELAKKANVGRTADGAYAQLKRLCAGPKEIEALLVIAQFGGPGLDPNNLSDTALPAVVGSDNSGSIITAQHGRSAGPTVDSSGGVPPATGSTQSEGEDNELDVVPCSTCGGRGRIERSGSRPGLFSKLLGAEHVVERCPECNGTGADVSLKGGGLTGR